MKKISKIVLVLLVGILVFGAVFGVVDLSQKRQTVKNEFDNDIKTQITELQKKQASMDSNINTKITELQKRFDSTVQRFSAVGVLNTTGVTVNGFVEYVRLAPKKGLLNIGLYFPENTNDGVFAVCDLQMLGDLLGLSFKHQARYVTGLWASLQNPIDSGMNYGNSCLIHESGFIHIGRYYDKNRDDLGWWPQAVLGGHSLSITNVFVEEN